MEMKMISWFPYTFVMAIQVVFKKETNLEPFVINHALSVVGSEGILTTATLPVQLPTLLSQLEQQNLFS